MGLFTFFNTLHSNKIHTMRSLSLYPTCTQPSVICTATRYTLHATR